MKRNKEITVNRNSLPSQFSAGLNCNYVESVRKGRLFILELIEKCYFEGVRKSYWFCYADMFRVLRGVGLRYNRTSYFRFKSGEFNYIPSPFISILVSIVGSDFAHVEQLAKKEVERVIARHPERWG